MDKPENHSIADLLVILSTNLFNLIMVGVFYLRVIGVNHPLLIGFIWVALLILLATGAFLNIKAKRERWFIVLPLIFVVFLILELILDYILQLDFRNTGLLAPYMILYYLSSMGMIGYTFLVEKKWGAWTLATYFLSQIAAVYSFYQVGHG